MMKKTLLEDVWIWVVDVFRYVFQGYFLVSTGRYIILTSGRIAEPCLLFATLWVTATSVAPTLTARLGDLEGSLTSLAFMAFSLLPEVILFSAIVTVWKNVEKIIEKSCFTNWLWTILYGLPTFSFFIMTLITIGSFVESHGHVLVASGFLLSVRCFSGWFYGLVGLIHASINTDGKIFSSSTFHFRKWKVKVERVEPTPLEMESGKAFQVEKVESGKRDWKEETAEVESTFQVESLSGKPEVESGNITSFPGKWKVESLEMESDWKVERVTLETLESGFVPTLETLSTLSIPDVESPFQSGGKWKVESGKPEVERQGGKWKGSFHLESGKVESETGKAVESPSQHDEMESGKRVESGKLFIVNYLESHPDATISEIVESGKRSDVKLSIASVSRNRKAYFAERALG